MRKFYSIVLMATALLIGTNAWANEAWNNLPTTQGANKISVTIGGVTKYAANLQDAVDAVNENEAATITLLGDQELTATVKVPNYTNTGADTLSTTNPTGVKPIRTRGLQDITLDLNGFNITEQSGKKIGLIQLVKGRLHITGEGELRQTHAKGANNIARSVIFVSGAPYANKNEEWSTLIIDENVFLNATGKEEGSAASTVGDVAKNYGITVDQLTCEMISGTGRADFSQAYKSWGSVGYATGGFSVTQSSYAEKDATDLSVDFPAGSNISCWAKATWEKKDLNNDGKIEDSEKTGRWKAKAAGSAYGVKIIVKGKIYGNMRAINFAGNINATPVCDENWTTKGRRISNPTAEGRYYNVFYPYIRIEKTATLFCLDQGLTDGNGAIYAGGYGVWDISGNLYGQTGIFVKSGDVKLIDATVKSTSTDSYNDPNYNETVSGSGIFIASDASYGGNIDVEITGDTKVTGGGSAAIFDAIATTTENTQVSDLSITGGTIEPGAEGGITLTQNTAKETEVTGGNIQGNVTIEGTTTTVSAIVPKTGYHTTEVTDESGKTIIVVSQGDAPTGDANVAAGHNASSSVKWTGASETISADLELKELEINEATAQVLTIAAGKTLKVGRVVLGKNAQIIVEAGAKFIVTGAQGIVAPVTSNIVLKNEEGKRSIFLFNPDVTSNKHPNAIFEIESYSWRNATTKEAQSEVFGIPTHSAVKSIECLTAGKHGYIQGYNASGTWENIAFTDANPFPYEKLNKPFAAYALFAYREQSDPKLTFRFGGELVGNDNATLTSSLSWSFFANSYTAEVDLDAFLTGLDASAQSVTKYIYVAKLNGEGEWYWETLDKEGLNEEGASTKLQPMQGFLLHNTGMQVESNAINYKKMVYAPAVPGYAGAPRRSVVANNYTAKLHVAVTSETGAYDNVKLRETENVKFAEKYMNADVNIYAMADEKSAIVNAENLENTYVGFSTVKGGKFTISFANVEGREFELVDHETGARVAIAEGNTYEFTADANTANDYRFEIVGRANMPTAIDNTEAVKSVKGVYTITGQYVGEMNVWNTLPAGVYVVNGEKRVK